MNHLTTYVKIKTSQETVRKLDMIGEKKKTRIAETIVLVLESLFPEPCESSLTFGIVKETDRRKRAEAQTFVLETLFTKFPKVGVAPLPRITNESVLGVKWDATISTAVPLYICEKISALAQINNQSYDYTFSFLLDYAVKEYEQAIKRDKEFYQEVLYNVLLRVTHGFYENNGENQKELEQLIKTALSWATEQ